MPGLIIPDKSVISSFTTRYIASTLDGVAGHQPQPTLQDILTWGERNMITADTPRNVGGCIHVEIDTTRAEPWFVIVLSTPGLLQTVQPLFKICGDDTWKVCLQGYGLKVVGQNDADRHFHPAVWAVSTNMTQEVGRIVLQALKTKRPDLQPKSFLGDAAPQDPNAAMEVFDTCVQHDMCAIHVKQVNIYYFNI